MSFSLYLLVDFLDVDGHTNINTKNELRKNKTSHLEGRWSYSSVSYCHVKRVPEYQCNPSTKRLPVNHQGQRQPSKEYLQKIFQDHLTIKVDVAHFVHALKHTPILSGYDWVRNMETKIHVLKRYRTTCPKIILLC